MNKAALSLIGCFLIILLAIGMSSCKLLQLDENVVHPQFRVQCVLDGKEYDYSGRGSFLNAGRSFSSGYTSFSSENSENLVEIDYEIHAPSIVIRCYMSFYATDHVNYHTKYFLKKNSHNSLESRIVGSVNTDTKHSIESCSFYFEKPEPEDSLALYYFLFDMDLEERESNKPVALRNGKITFYKGCYGNEVFVSKITNNISLT